MRQLFVNLGVLVSSLSAVAIPARRAPACEPSPCDGGLFLLGPIATIPPNAVGIPFWPSTDQTPAPITLERLDGASWRKVPVELLPDSAPGMAPGRWPITVAAPKGQRPWSPGKVYRVTLAELCQYQRTWAGAKGPIVVTTAGEEAPLPGGQTLVLRASPVAHGKLKVMTWHGSCAREVEASSVELEAALPPAAAPWAALLVWETRVDGDLWHPSDSLPEAVPPGMSWRGRGRDRIYAICESDREHGLAPGRHQVVMSARVAGTDAVLSAAPVAVELGCP